MSKTCHITVLNAGPQGAPAFHVQVATRGGSHSEFQSALTAFKQSVPQEQRYFAGYDDPADQNWYVHDSQLETVKTWALEHYAEVYLIEGARETNLRTGRATEQSSLFGG
jgi:hypothetical protein